MDQKASTFKKGAFGFLLGSLLWAAACAEGEVPRTYAPSPYPVYNYPYYYPDLRYQEQDPQFWQMWQDRQGGGG